MRLSWCVAVVLLTGLAPAVEGAAAPGRAIPGEYIVKYRMAADATARASVRSRGHARLLGRLDLIRAEHVRIAGPDSAADLARLRADPEVEYVEPNFELRADRIPNDPRLPELYGLHNTGQTGGTAGDDIHAPEAWDLFTGDPDLRIGVIDTGIDAGHPDLAGNVWTNLGETGVDAQGRDRRTNHVDDDGDGYIDDVHGYDFVNGDGDPFDDNGHGTHVAGTIAAVGDNGLGVVGVAWHAKLVAIKFLDASGTGSTVGAIAALQYAIAVGVRVTNNSWGGNGYSQALLDAIEAAGEAGELFVAAAGNDGADTDVSPHYPSGYDSPYVISVAATDADDRLAPFSNYGAVSVDLAAPGVDILSLQPGGGYRLLSGTSMATPHVTGTVALMLGRFPELDPIAARSVLLDAAEPRPQLAGLVATGGRLDAFRALAEPDFTPPGAIEDLAVADTGSNSVGLRWTATGDDGGVGRAARYDLRVSTAPITPASFASALQLAAPDPAPAGSVEVFEVKGLSTLTHYYFALRAVDEFRNAGPVSNVADATTLGPPRLGTEPDAISADLLSGAATTRTLTLRNDGEGTLDFTIPEPEVALDAAGPYALRPLAKGEPDTRVGDAVAAHRGGPDAFGYRWIDSLDPEGPVFAWLDPPEGAEVDLTGDDAVSGPIPLGMRFPFYGQLFDSVRVGTNGYLSFTDPAPEYANQPLPSAGAPANLVAPFWDDLDFGAARLADAWSDGTRFVVTWLGVRALSPAGTAPGGPYTFQAILEPDGGVRFQYLAMGLPTDEATVGLQDGRRATGLTVAFNAPYVRDSMAVRFERVPQWLTVSPSSGRVRAGGSESLEVRLSALGLPAGPRTGEVTIESNDADRPERVVPVSLQVLGAPDVTLDPTALDFGEAFVGSDARLDLTLSNPGTEALDVTSIASSEPSVVAPDGGFQVPAGGSHALAVSWHPETAGPLDGRLELATNDPDAPSLVIPLRGTALPAPSFTVAPDSFAVELVSGTATSRALRITNRGSTALHFAAGAVEDGGAPAPRASASRASALAPLDEDVPPAVKGAPDVARGPVPTSAGGPDGFGYSYRDSDDPEGPSFEWEDVRGDGVPIALTGDDANAGPMGIGFGFPFYGRTFDTFRVSTNGFVSLTSAKTTFLNTPLPDAGPTAPENLLAVMWDDLEFDQPVQAWYRADGRRLIVQFQDVARVGETSGDHPNTFEVVLEPDGTVLYRYLSIRALDPASATVGIQNAARDVGLQVAYNVPYLEDSLAVRFTPPARYLTVTPASGTVAPGGTFDLSVGFNASGRYTGDYLGRVRVSGDDPSAPALEVAARLTVHGVPALTVVPPALDFGRTYAGFGGLAQLSLENPGTGALSVSGVSVEGGPFSVDRTQLSIPPGGHALLDVGFHPAEIGSYRGTMTLTSDDPVSPTRTVPLAGSAVAPPVTLSPDTLRVALAPGLTPESGVALRPLVVANRGTEPVEWSARVAFEPPSEVIAPPVAAAAEPPAWLSVAPDSGALAPGTSDTLWARVEADTLTGSERRARIEVQLGADGFVSARTRVTLHLGVAGAGLQLVPRVLESRAPGRWVTAAVSLEGGLEPDAIDRASVRLAAVVPPVVDPPGSEPAWMFRFERAAVARLLPAGDRVPVTIAGLVPGVTWFAARDTIRVPGARGAGAARADGEGSAPPRSFGLALLGRNPMRGAAALELDLPEAAAVTVRVFDLRGALVRTLARGARGAGRHRLEWDGCDPAGNRAGPGIYFIRADAGKASARLRVVLLR